MVGEDGARQAVESTLNAKSKEIENVRKKIADPVRNVDLTNPKSRETLQKLKAKEAELQQTIETYSAALERLQNPQQQGQDTAAPQGETHQAGGEDPRLVPVFTEDDPKKARGRGWRKTVSEMINRPGPVKSLRGNPTSVKFSTKHTQDGVYAVVEADGLQPSHTQGQKNPYHFLDEAQPKDREGKDSVKASRDMAANINPVEITGGVTAYTGSPSINARGEVIQGNNRSDALKYMYSSEPQAAARYKQYLIDHAADFGLDAEAVARMEHPVLVNLLDVADEDAIALGQYTQADLESGGIQAISAQNAATLLANKGLFGRFANILLRGAEDEGISELVVRNGRDALVFLRNVAGAINDTQFRSAFRNDRGELTPEAKTSLADMLTRQLLGGNRSLQDMFHGLPAKAQKAIAATAFRDLQSPESERLQDELRASIVAFHALMQDPNFAAATNYETARRAMEAAKRQMNTDFATGSDVAIMEKFSNFALTLAALYKGSTQKQIQATFNDIYNYVQGTWEQGLFDTGTPTPHTLEESIKHVLGIEYQPINRNKNGHTRSDNVDNDAPQGEAGGQGSPRNAASGEQGTQTEQPADSGRGTDENSGARVDETQQGGQGQNALSEVSSAERTEMESRIIDWLSDENLSKASGKTRDEIFIEFGNELEPIAYIPAQFIPLVDTGLTDPRIYCGKGYFIDHALRNHAGTGEQMPIENVDASKYLNIQSVLDNPDSIKETYVDGKRTVVFIKKIGRFFAELTQVEENGRIVLHKSLFNQKKEPYAKLKDIRSKQASPEGGTSSISHADNAAPAISLQSRGDVMPKRNDIWRTPKDATTSFESKDTDKSSVTQTIGEKVAKAEEETDTNPSEALKANAAYTISSAQYTTKRGKVLDMFLVKFPPNR